MTKEMTRFLVLVLVCSSFGCFGNRKSQDQEDADGWIPLLKDNTLDGWYTFLEDRGTNHDPDGIFAIHNGVLHIYKNAEDGAKMPMGYIATKKEYENYRLRLQFKWGTKKFAPRATAARDSGLLYHFVGNDMVWPLSTECQIMEGDTGTIYTVGSTVTTTIDPVTKAYKQAEEGGILHTQGGPEITQIKMDRDWEVPGWNTVEVIVRNGGATHIINGKVNNRCWDIRRQDPFDSNRMIPFSRGKILIQAEGAEIFYRNIEIKLLEQ